VHVVKSEGRPLRSWVALAAAVALHAALGGLALVIPRRAPKDAERLPSAAIAAEIEIDATRAEPAAPSAVEPSPPNEPSSERASREAIVRRSAAVGSETAGPSEATRSPEAIAPRTEGGYALDPTAPRADRSGDGRRVDLGIGSGDWSRWVDPTAHVAAPPPPRPESTAPPASSTGGLAEALEAHDRELGLGPAGPVLSAAHEAGHSDVAPAIGTATFAITVTRAGGIQVDLVGASSNVEGWRKVADNMAAAIKRKPPRIESGRNGVRIGLELVAEEKWPNGSVARSEGPAFAISGGAIRSTTEAIEDSTKRNPLAVPPPGSPAERAQLKLGVDVPGVSIKGRGKVCSYQAGVGLLGPMLSGGCDPSNIGAHAQRVVSAKVTNQTTL
jgi:hypothetical protein